MSPTAAELNAVMTWTASHAPSRLARVIAGVAIRNGEVSIGGVRNHILEQALCPDLTRAELDQAFTDDRALMVDAGYDFEEQVLRALVFLQLHPLDSDPARAFASNVQNAFLLEHGESLTLGAVIVAAFVCGYALDPCFIERDRIVDGDAFFEIPAPRSPAIEIFGRGCV
jgi:hypothetical protein